jgi:WD40 repeat protein
LKVLNDELNNINLSINLTVYQEVESARKKLENLTKKEKISSTIKFSTHFDKIKDFVCENTITEHTNYITDILISTEDNKIITSCDDMNIRVFDANQNFKCIQILKGHTGPVTKIIYLNKIKDSTKLLSGSEDDTIKIWEMKNSSTYEFKCINTLKGQGGTITLFALINNDDGMNEGKFASAAGDLTIRIWEPKGDYKNSTSITNVHLGKITGLKVYRNNIFLISCSEDKTINIYSLRDENKLIIKLKEHTDKINDILLCKFNFGLHNKLYEKSVSSLIKDGKETESINVTTENKKLASRKTNKEKSIDKEKEKDTKDKDSKDKENKDNKDKDKEKSITEKSSFFGLNHPDRYFLISNSLDCNLCLFDIDNKFKLLIKQKIHKMVIKSLIQVSDNLYISISLDKSVCFWNLSITQEIAEEPESKDKKKKKKEENKEKENKEKEEIVNRIIVSFNCIGQINDLKWLTNIVLFYPFKRTVYIGSQDKTIKIYRILNYNEYQNDNKTNFIFKNVGSLKGHNREVTLIKALGDKIISAGNDFTLKIWKDN